ncbi:LOW QUALITY PROTEIN: Phosphoserine aminotransferase [Phytophthora palmivora]|uniref:Phosphoserine aminotransferase n=1 Tax=Phytophthora palmivora TaxID=4796 RepID=A0A2P4YLV0_9STRA|nr:LOW QUALITY PROTEIN: Phosphoserine aminotransferase [Phytophthora palmivora]
MFRLTKEKFSDDNRKQALEELLQQTNERSQQVNEEGSHETSQKRRGGKKSSMQSLSLDMLKRVTDVDVYLDNVLRRKAVADAKNQQKFRKPISSQEIAETDSKLRNQLTRFLVSSQKSKHHSRLKVVTWVICSIMAKTYALLLSDDKLPDEDGADGDGSEVTRKVAESDKEECDCCCVGKETCTCSCTCKCHVESSDEEEEYEGGEESPKVSEVDDKLEIPGNPKFPVMPTDPFATRFAKLNQEVKVTLEEVKSEVKTFLDSQLSHDHQPQTTKDILLILSSLENHLISKFSDKTKPISWAGRRSVLELLPELLDDNDDNADENETSAARWLHNLMRTSEGDRSCANSSNSIGEKHLQEIVLPFIRECRAVISSSSSLSSLSSEKQKQWITRRVSVELGCACKTSALPVLKTDQDFNGEEVSVIKFTGSLDLYNGDDSFEDAATPGGKTGESPHQKFLTEQALEKLRKCPFLVDVSLYMDWQERYAPLCGPLLSFIRVYEMILLDHAPSNNFMFVCCLNGTILRINEKSTPSDLELLLTRAHQEKTQVIAGQVAVHLVSMVVTCKGQANFPKQLVQAHLRGYLVRFSKDKSAEGYTERLVLEVLMETPVEFADFVMSLLLGVVSQITGSSALNEWGVANQVWKACRSDAERKALLFISNRSTSPLWVNQTEKWRAVRESLTGTIVEEDAGNEANSIDKNTIETKVVPTSLASSNAEDESNVSNLLDTSNSVAPTFSNDSLDQEMEDMSAVESSTTADSCRTFIEDLRKKQFGVGLQIEDEATNSVLLIQQQRLERALKRLSDELYSESTHFVLELLQNADDNNYDSSVVPLGDFTLTTDKEIVFYNNEQGFSPANIQAICDVGASTKAAVDSEASIGKKGIGFKSVFKVSDNPQVHSNGFHICFHAKNSKHGNGMGYILPYWLDDATQWKQRHGTTFVLPLNNASVQRVDDISQSLMAFESSVLLFLRRIRELRLRDLTRQHTLQFLKKEKRLQTNTQLVQLYSQVKKNENCVEVTQQNWLVVKEKLKPPQSFSRIHPTEIALAFPVAHCGQEFTESGDRPPLQQVFCYLPLRSYGFRFILQGDFEIPSSREAITNGSEWNEWLVSKFPKLVRTAVSSYVSRLPRGQTNEGVSDNAKMIAATLHLLSLLPLENEVQAPFRSIIPEIMRELRQVKWLACAQSKEVLSPEELIDCIELTGSDTSENMAMLLEALNADVLTSTFNKRFLHPTLSRGMVASMKCQLRIEQLHSSHLMRVLSLSAEKNDIDWTVKILTLLAKLWRKDRHSHLLRQELRLIKCFPLQRKGSKGSNTTWISLAEGLDSLFVSGVEDNTARCGKSYQFYGDLRILDGDFTKAVNKSPKLRTFLLNDVGVHVMEDHDLIRHHILPKMTMLRSPVESLEQDASVVIEYGKFLSSHLVSCHNCPMQMEVKTNMVVATSSGRVVGVDIPNLFMVLPSLAQDNPELVSWITTKSTSSNQDENAFAIVSGEYFSDTDSVTSSKVTMDEQWQQLLVSVCELPSLFDVASLSTNARSQAGVKQLLKWIELEGDISLKRSVSTCLAQYLDKHWRVKVDDDSTDPTHSIDNQEDTFDFWRHHRWLEGSDGLFHRSTELWQSVEAVTRLFTPAMVTFSSMVWKNEDFSGHVLGLKTAPTTTDLLSTIASLSVDSTLVSTLEIEQMIRMYLFLWEECQRSDTCRDEITKAFTCKMMIFIPTKAGTELSEHHFIGTKNAVWSSTTHNGELIALETLYPKTLCEFFVEVCGVQKKPSVSFLCEMITGQHSHFLTKLSSGKPSESEKVKLWKKKLLPLLCALSKKVNKRSVSKADIKEIKKTLKSTPWLPVRRIGVRGHGLMFCSSKDQPVHASTENEQKLQKLMMSLTKDTSTDKNDSSLVGKKCKNQEDIKMVQLESFADDGDLDALLSFAKVSTLSTHIETQAKTWCKVFVSFTKSSQLDNKKGRKKLMKLGQLLVRSWASAFTSASSDTEQDATDFQNSLQHMNIFPVVDENNRWGSAVDMYINDQTELSKEDLQHSRQAEQIQVLGLFSWNYFVNDSASKDTNEVNHLRTFLTEFCGMKSLKEHVQYEVSVLSTQHSASEAFHEKLRTAFGLAQRFLFHSHRHLYDQLHHDVITKLASELQCVLVDGHDGFQVVYRIGNSFSLRRGINAHAQCFLDVSKSTLYLQFVTGDEEASALSPVLMELSRKLFGAQVAPNIANLLYLSLLQPSTPMREQWLVETQLLPPLPASEADNLWVHLGEDVETSTSALESTNRKRVSEDMEDGEVTAEDVPAKMNYAPYQHNHQTWSSPVPTLPPSTNYNTDGSGENYGMQTQRPRYPPIPVQSISGSAGGAPYHPPLPMSSGPGMQTLSLSNTMTKEEREAIGRWGEEYVFNQLKQQHAETESNMTVEWVNEKEESGLPYDLTLSSSGKVVEYIEVKSTRTMEKGVFEISMNELDQAAIHGSTYSIYRVFNAGNPALCRVIRMKNPVSLVRQRKIQLALVMQ